MKKNILITGAGHGFGRGLALALAEKGYHVIATVQVEPQVTDLIRDAKERNLDMSIFRMDITDEFDYKQLDNYDIDILFNNAAIGEGGPIAEIPMRLVRAVFETNFFGTLNLTQYVVRNKFIPKKKGRIINVSSIVGIMTFPYFGAYCATKHAIEAVTYALNEELKPFNITACTVNPGAYFTGSNDRMIEATWSWFNEKENFTSKDEILKVTNKVLDNQMDPDDMVKKMVEIVEMDEHPYRNIYPPQSDADCKQFVKDVWNNTVKNN